MTPRGDKDPNMEVLKAQTQKCNFHHRSKDIQMKEKQGGAAHRPVKVVTFRVSVLYQWLMSTDE